MSVKGTVIEQKIKKHEHPCKRCVHVISITSILSNVTWTQGYLNKQIKSCLKLQPLKWKYDNFYIKNWLVSHVVNSWMNGELNSNCYRYAFTLTDYTLVRQDLLCKMQNGFFMDSVLLVFMASSLSAQSRS